MTADTLRQTVTITNPQGFHMRPMAAFVEAARLFPGCTVTVTRSGMVPVDGKSMLSLMGLVAVQGAEVLLEVSGPGAGEALSALVHVFHRNFDEE
ncbi:MAG: HPr family phosphocarrier protein [Gemmataceae bacterium]|nr:HPr family phosphocarrier protein [Gemmataceae bacterium]